jgi:hypothetical protein
MYTYWLSLPSLQVKLEEDEKKWQSLETRLQVSQTCENQTSFSTQKLSLSKATTEQIGSSDST